MKSYIYEFFLSTIILITFSSCSNGGSSTATVSGTDVSGTYNQTDIECLNSSLTVVNNSTTYSGIYTDQIVVTGNTFTENYVVGTCNTSTTGNIVVNTGLTLSNMVVKSASGGTCTATTSLNGTTITPTSSSTTFSSGETIPGLSNVPFVYNLSTKALGILSNYSDGTSPYCFIVYTKQ